MFEIIRGRIKEKIKLKNKEKNKEMWGTSWGNCEMWNGKLNGIPWVLSHDWLRAVDVEHGKLGKFSLPTLLRSYRR